MFARYVIRNSAAGELNSCSRLTSATKFLYCSTEDFVAEVSHLVLCLYAHLALAYSLQGVYYLQRSYPSEYKRYIRIEFIIISIEDTSGSSWLYLINALTYPSSPLHPFAFSF